MEAMLEKNKLLFKNMGRNKESVWGNVSTMPEFKVRFKFEIMKSLG